MAEWDIGKLISGLQLSLGAPETMEPARETQPVIDRPQMLTPQLPTALPQMQASEPGILAVPRAMLNEKSWADVLQLSLMAAGNAGLLGEGSAGLAKMNQNMMEKRRLDQASQQTQAITNMVSLALESGDPAALSNVVKQMSGIKGLHPETVQAMQKLQIGLAEQINKSQVSRRALSAIPPEMQGKRVSILRELLAQGVDPDTAKTIVSLVPEEKAPEPFTLSAGQQRLIPNAQGGFNVIEGPPERAAKLQTDDARDLAASGVNIGGRTSYEQFLPQELDQINRVRSQRRVNERVQIEATLDGIRQQRGEREYATKQLPVSQTRSFLDADTLQFTHRLTAKQLDEGLAGGSILPAPSAAELTRVKELRGVMPNLIDFYELSGKILAKNPGANITNAGRLAIQRGLASSAEVARWTTLKNMLSLSMTRIAQGSRPSDFDLKTVNQAMPGTTDTDVTAHSKIGGLVSILDNAATSYLGAPAMTNQLRERWNKVRAPVLPGATRRTKELSKDFQ